MEETLGKRIIGHRKKLNMTQDKLAERLGVTAQAVSKWENDQSCPDITMLPKLAEIFGISIDALLGVAAQSNAIEAEVVNPIDDEQEPEGVHYRKGNWEFHWDAGRNSRVWFAVWVLLMGGMMLYNVFMNRQIGLWGMAWPCALFLFGLSLLIDALHAPKGHRFAFTHNGKNPKRSRCEVNGEHFVCDLSFGEKDYIVDTPRLQHGDVNVSFGELTVDLSSCEEIASGCTVDAGCSFGELTIKVPRRYRVEADADTSFGHFEVSGSPDPEPEAVIRLDASVSFGNFCLQYI